MSLQLHRTQGQVFRDASPFRAVVAGRRWGKTRLAIAECLSRVNDAKRIWYVAPTYDMARDVFWADLKAALPPGWKMAEPNETRLEIRLRTGALIQLKSADHPDSLRGRGLNFVVLDEYQDMDPVVWSEALAPALLDTHGHALFLGTPKSFNHLYDAYQRGQSPDDRWSGWRSWQFKSIDAAKPHGHLDPDMIEMFRNTLDERSFRQEFEASFETMAGRVYYAFDRNRDVQPVTLDPALPVCLTFDFNVEPSCALIGQRQGPLVRVWREVRTRHAGGEATRATARKVAELISLSGYRGELRIYGDPSGRSAKTTGPSDHAVLRELFPGATWCIPGRAPHVRDRVAAVNGRCQSMTGQRSFAVDPACLALIADLEQVVFAGNGDIDKSTNLELTHLSDALGYWIVADFPPAPRTMAGTMRLECLT